MFSPTRRPFVTLDIAADRASLAVFVRRGGDTFELLSVHTLAVDFGNGANKAAYEQIAQFLRSHRAELRRAKSIAVTLPAHVALMKAISTPAVPPNKRAKIIEFEASQAIPFPLEELTWDWSIMAENVDSLDICVTAIKAHVIRAVIDAAAEAEMTVSRAIPASLAMIEAFRRTHRDSAAPALVICIGGSATQLLYICGERYAARSLAFSGAASSREFASDCAVNGFARRLTSEITRSLVHFQQQFSSDPVADLYLANSGDRPELGVALATCLERDIKRFDPLENLPTAPCFRQPMAAVDSGALCSLVGATAFAGLVVEEGLNLLPTQERNDRAFQRRQPSLVAAAVLGAVALALPVVHLAREHRALASELLSCETERRSLQASRQRGTAIAERVSAAVKDAERIQRIERMRMAWREFLADLESRVTASGDIWIERLAPLALGDSASAGSDRKDDLPLRLELAGQVVERSAHSEPNATAPRQNSADQLKHLLMTLRASPFVASIRDERFEPNGAGALRFAVVVTLAPQALL
jgi:type IV pilus assembly protein PilM